MKRYFIYFIAHGFFCGAFAMAWCEVKFEHKIIEAHQQGQADFIRLQPLRALTEIEVRSGV